MSDAEQNCVLAVDIGTTALKAAVINVEGGILDFSRIEFSSIDCNDELVSTSISEKWLLAFKAACKKMRGVLRTVRAICVSGNGPTVVFSDGTTLLWNEPISVSSVGNSSIFLPRILAAKKMFPAQWQSEQKIFGTSEYLIYKLCGAEVAVLPEERFKAAYWSEEILRALNIPQKKLCPFAPPAKTLGLLNENVAEELGFENSIPVVGAGPDFVAALVGTNTLRQGALCDRAGSSEGINWCTPSPVFEKEIRTMPSVVAPLWNASFLIQDAGGTNSEKAKNFAKGISVLRKIAEESDTAFSETVVITGGQARNENLIQQKANVAKIKIALQQIPDAELLGDAAFAFTALGEFDSIQNAAAALCKTQKIFCPQNTQGGAK